jgi:hypothetical protein
MKWLNTLVLAVLMMGWVVAANYEGTRVHTVQIVAYDFVIGEDGYCMNRKSLGWLACTNQANGSRRGPIYPDRPTFTKALCGIDIEVAGNAGDEVTSTIMYDIGDGSPATGTTATQKIDVGNTATSGTTYTLVFNDRPPATHADARVTIKTEVTAGYPGRMDLRCTLAYITEKH